MILHYLLWLLVPKWNELITNPTTGKASSKSLFGALGFFVAIGIVAWGQAAAIVHNRPIDNAAVLLLLLNGLGLAGAKIAQLYLNRKTADDQGQPLAVPPPAQSPPPVMPQVFSGEQLAEIAKSDSVNVPNIT